MILGISIDSVQKEARNIMVTFRVYMTAPHCSENLEP